MHDHSNGKFQIRRLTIPPRYLSCAATPAGTNNSAMQTIHTDFIMLTFGCALLAKDKQANNSGQRAATRRELVNRTVMLSEAKHLDLFPCALVQK